MKTLLNLFLLSLVCGVGISQNEITPPSIEFSNLSINWLHVSNDTNYLVNLEDFPESTTYSNKVPLWMDFHEGYIYFFEQNLGPLHGLLGFSLFKVDAETGELIWELFDNYNNGLDHTINYFNNTYCFNDDELHVYGYKSLEPIPSQNGLFYYSRPIQKTIDLDSGEIVNSISSDNEIGPSYANFTGIGLGNIHKTANDRLFHFQNSGSIIDSIVHNEIYIHKINERLEIDSNYHRRISYNTGIRSEELSLVARPLYRFTSDSTFVSLNMIRDVYDLQESPSLATIDWWRFDSSDSIEFINQIDVTDFFYKQSNFYKNLNFSTFRDEIIITQYIDENEAEVESPFAKLNWYDKEGILIGNIEIESNSDKNYSRIKPLFIEDNILYFAVHFNDAQFSGNDIFKYDPSFGMEILIGSIKTEIVDSLIHPDILDVLKVDENNVVLGYRFIYDIDATSSTQYSNFNYYFNFNLSDLGISTNLPKISINPAIHIFPNPSQHFISIELEENFSGEIIISDNSGKLVLNNSLENEKKKDLEIISLNPGVYFITLVNANTSYTKQFFKF